MLRPTLKSPWFHITMREGLIYTNQESLALYGLVGYHEFEGLAELAIDEIVSDGFATTAFSTDSVPGVYIDTDGNELIVLYQDGSGYSSEDEILVDGQGNVFENQLIEAVSWTITTTGALQIVFLEVQDVDTVTLLNFQKYDRSCRAA